VGQNYAGELTRDQIVARLATACGALGSSADYLFDTCRGLREHSIDDFKLEKLEAEVTAHSGR
jgi:cation transport protein ChaC